MVLAFTDDWDFMEEILKKQLTRLVGPADNSDSMEPNDQKVRTESQPRSEREDLRDREVRMALFGPHASSRSLRVCAQRRAEVLA